VGLKILLYLDLVVLSIMFKMSGEIIKEFKKSFSLLINNKSKVFISTGFDLLFYVLTLLFGFYFFNKFMEKFESMNSILTNVVLADEEFSQDILLRLNDVSGALSNMLMVALGFFVLVFILWGILNSVVWLTCVNILKNKKAFSGYNLNGLLRYYLLSLVWFLIAGGLLSLFYNYNSEILSLDSLGILIVNLPILFILYFGSISFSLFFLSGNVLKSFKNCFRLGLSKFVFLISLIFFVLLFYFFELVLLFLKELLSSDIFSVLGIVAFLLIMVWFRVHLLLIVEKYAGDRI